MTRWIIYRLPSGYHGCKPIPADADHVFVKGVVVDIVEGTKERAIARCGELEKAAAGTTT